MASAACVARVALLTLIGADASSPWATFVLPRVEAVEGAPFVSIMVYGDVVEEGANISAYLEIVENRTNATFWTDYQPWGWEMLFTSSTSVNVFAVDIVQNAVWEPPKVATFRLVTDPPEALGWWSHRECELWILDDGDGGTLSIADTNIVEEKVVTGHTGEYENETCAVYAERVGAFSGNASLRVQQLPCREAIPTVRKEADDFLDYRSVPQLDDIVWSDGEGGKKCVVGLLTQEHVQDFLDGIYSQLDPHALWIMLDGKAERDETICFRATEGSVTQSSAKISLEYFQVTIEDSQANPLQCVRGASCDLDLVNSTLLPPVYGTWAWVQDGSVETCLTCEEASAANESRAIPFNVSEHADGRLHANLGMDLLWWPPGHHTICECWTVLSSSRQVASMFLAGPFRRNSMFCVMSYASCWIPDLEVERQALGRDHLQIATDCVNPTKTSQGMLQGGHGILSQQGFVMNNTNEMRRAPNGIYQLCWCREMASRRCDGPDDYQAVAGSFIWAGPNRRPPQTALLGARLALDQVFGTALRDGDKAMLLSECGKPQPTSAVIALLDGTSLDFGALSTAAGFAARTYELCYCSVGLEHMTSPCTEPEHFLANFGSLQLICDSRSVDLAGDGRCQLCPYMFQEAGGPIGMDCVVSFPLLGASLAWVLLLILLFSAIFGNLRAAFRQGLHGTPRVIEDISRQRGKLLIRTAGLHNLMTFKNKPIPVTLWDTGHFLLDSKVGKEIKLYVIPFDEHELEVVQPSSDSVEFSADSSMGTLRTGLLRTLMHASHSAIPCSPLMGQLLVLLLGVVLLPLSVIAPQPSEIVGCVLLGLVLAALRPLSLSLSVGRRPTTRHQQLLKAYETAKQRDGNKETREVERGPLRGIRIWKLLELHKHFQGVIQDRNMYYLDPNIVRPLTSRVKLSFSEYVGPDEVEWFVSHWWGTKVNVYCDALKRHASEVKARQDKDETGWENTTYWICTFSNNQYQIQKELGQTHTESSFYLALHSPGLKGTCMLLDEKAMPLARSWCLFELLQTIELEEKAEAQNRPFAGLLFCTSNGVLNYGSSTVDMSMQIGERLLELSLADAQASTEKDKAMIAELVQTSRGSFEEIDTELRTHIRDALKACQKQVNLDFTSLFERLPHDAPPDANTQL